MQSLDERLAAQDEAWEQTKVEDNYSIIPEGKYQAVVVESKLKINQYTGILQLYFQFAITGPSHIGRRAHISNDIEGEYSKYAKKNLHTMGFPIEKASEIKKQNIIEKLIGKHAELFVQVKILGDGKPANNFYINKLIETGSVMQANSDQVQESEFDFGGADNIPESDVPF